MKKRVQYQTIEGKLIMESNIDPTHAHMAAIRKAKKMGETTLVAIDSELKRTSNYSSILQRQIARQS